MKLGFETIGNATIIVHDGKPVLATDPWIDGGAYFGSWTFSHEIPGKQRESIRRAEYVWFSHGHPDHLNPISLPLFQGQKILLPDHFGGRILHHLKQSGFDVHLLKDHTWVSLSPKVRVYCNSDYNQDAILLIDVDGRLLIDLNDASDRGWMPTVSTDRIDLQDQLFDGADRLRRRRHDQFLRREWAIHSSGRRSAVSCGSNDHPKDGCDRGELLCAVELHAPLPARGQPMGQCVREDR